MNKIIKFPQNAFFGKMITKSKIYDHYKPTTKVKNLFISEVEKIIWSYKLSDKTINIPSGKEVEEIQIFTIELKGSGVSEDVLKVIDYAIPSPILFLIKREKEIKYKLSYKRQNEVDSKKWVISNYFESDWIMSDINTIEIPIMLNLDELYFELVSWFLPVNRLKSETMKDMVKRAEEIEVCEKELAQLMIRLKNEKQFKYKVEINSRINTLKDKILKIKI